MKHRLPKLLLDLTPLDTPSGPRGIGRYIRDLARGLSELPPDERSGIEIVGLTSLGWTGRYSTTADLAAFDGSLAHPPTEGDFYRWAYRQRVALWNAVRRIGADAVHVTDPHATPLLLGFSGARKIVTCHDLVPTRLPDHYFGVGDGGARIGKRIEARRYRSADLVVAVSDATRNDVCSLLDIPAEKVVRVHNGVDVERWSKPPMLAPDATLQKLGLRGRQFALYVGGSDFRKNVEGMMAGIARARALGVDIDLAWAGHLQPAHIAGVRAAAARAGVAGALRLLGFVADEELAVLYRTAVVHLFISRLEGFGLTVVEAMASGCPVLTTVGGALAEVAGDAAVTVDPDDHEAIGVNLARLAREPDVGAALRSRGFVRASRFTRLDQARAMMAVYRRFLGSRSAERSAADPSA